MRALASCVVLLFTNAAFSVPVSLTVEIEDPSGGFQIAYVEKKMRKKQEIKKGYLNTMRYYKKKFKANNTTDDLAAYFLAYNSLGSRSFKNLATVKRIKKINDKLLGLVKKRAIEIPMQANDTTTALVTTITSFSIDSKSCGQLLPGHEYHIEDNKGVKL